MPIGNERPDTAAWYNFVTGEYDYIETPEDFSDYMPQLGGRVLYQLYVERGMEPIEAVEKVLLIAIGEGNE